MNNRGSYLQFNNNPDPETHPHLKDVLWHGITRDYKYDIKYAEVVYRGTTFFGQYVHAVEIYPPAIDYVDYSNTRHLWTRDGLEFPNLKEMYEYNRE